LELFPAIEGVGIGIEFGLGARTHLNGIGEAFLCADGAPDAVFGMDFSFVVGFVPNDAEV
jgi:hypothetical protein